MDVSVIIVNYNTWNDLDNCLNSIVENTIGVQYEVIVVDNASSHETVEKYKNEQRAKVILNEKNIGFGRANNVGLKVANGKYVFLLNSDTILLNNAIKIFYDRMEQMDSSVACLGTYLLDYNKSIMHSYGSFPTIPNCCYMFWAGSWLRKIGIVREYMDNMGFDKEQCVDYINGAALFIRKNIGDRLGFFDPRFFLYYEETDMQKKYRDNGYSSRMILGPSIIHLSGRSSSGKSYAQSMRLPMMSHFVYLKKWNPYPLYLCYKILYIIMVCINYLLCPSHQKELYKVYLKSAFEKYPNP